MANSISFVPHASFSYPQSEIEIFSNIKRYICDKIGARTLRNDLLSGVPVPSELAPRQAILRWVNPQESKSKTDAWCERTGKDPFERANQLHDITDTHFGWLVSEAVKDLIQELEPGVHNFISFQVKKQGGSIIERPFWLLNICTRLDAIAYEVSDLVKIYHNQNESSDEWWYVAARNRGATNIAVHKKLIRGRAIWADSRWRRVFVSDHLAGRIKSGGFSRVDLLISPEV